jgi:putative glutamine amidotransferase
MSRPLIGLTIGPHMDDPAYLRLRSTYHRAVEGAGGLPVLVPPLQNLDALHELLGRLDGIVFPGGLDVDPAAYGEAAHPLTEVNPDLDRLELAVARWVAQSRVPTLGICRGQQLINVALGGSLVQHIEGHQQPGARSDLAHSIRVAPDSRLASILGQTDLRVNTHHHQAVQRVAPGLRAVAWAPDGTIEALESADRWLITVQYHPEDLVAGHEQSRRLFGLFVEAANSRLPALS